MGKITPLPLPAGPELTPPSGIEKSHDTSKFFSGKDSLDDWLKHRALKSEGRSARTYVVCQKQTVVAYYCIATGAVSRDAAPPKVARNTPDPIPLMIIGRLAVDKHFERQGIGSGLLSDAFKRILQAADAVGCRAIIVHAIDDDAAGFYRRFGFIEFPNGTKTMFLPLETVQATL